MRVTHTHGFANNGLVLAYQANTFHAQDALAGICWHILIMQYKLYKVKCWCTAMVQTSSLYLL